MNTHPNNPISPTYIMNSFLILPWTTKSWILYSDLNSVQCAKLLAKSKTYEQKIIAGKAVWLS